MTDTMKAGLFVLLGALIGAVPTWYIGLKQVDAMNEQLAFLKKQAVAAERERDRARTEADVLRRQFAEAPKKFIRKFKKLIDDAAAEGDRITKPIVPIPGEGGRKEPPKLIPYAHAIVSQRNSLRGELRGLEKLLNSDIDRLGQELANPNPDQRKVRKIVDTLKQTWAQKEEEIALRIRRLMATLEFLVDADKLTPSK